MLEYGFINVGNDANELGFTIDIQQDSNLQYKLDLIDTKTPSKDFKVVDNLKSEVMKQFISWLRYAVFEGDVGYLDDEKNELDNFDGTQTRPLGKTNEIKVWNKIMNICKERLDNYKTSLDQDLKLLDTNLTQNQINCVLLRSGEKKILHFLINTGE